LLTHEVSRLVRRSPHVRPCPISQDRWLDLNEVLRDLVAQGYLDQDNAEYALTSRRHAQNLQTHPLEFIAASSSTTSSVPGKKLDLETLTAWLAEQAGQPYMRIDPLKINVAAVTPLMSYAFAQRHKILAVAVDRDSVTIASAQPYVKAWEADLMHVLKLPIKRVVANPVDMQKLASSFTAWQNRSAAPARRSESEQPGQLRATAQTRRQRSGAGRQRRAHRQHR
jgi:general secretion pathway protein E